MAIANRCLRVALLALLARLAVANTITVASREWSPPPPTSPNLYRQWSDNARLQIGDVLVFKYDRSVDSVAWVANFGEYETCNASEARATFNDGHTHFTLSKSGSFYFISGNVTRCTAGEKIWIVVMASRRNRVPPGPPARPPPALNPPTASASPSPALSPPTASPSQSPSAQPVVTPPTASPSSSAQPVVSPSAAPTPWSVVGSPPSPSAQPVVSPSAAPTPKSVVGAPPSPAGAPSTAPMAVPSPKSSSPAVAPTQSGAVTARSDAVRVVSSWITWVGAAASFVPVAVLCV
eukprot:TRINITY_DN3264_c0_g1_i1.p1 TRINITY_DN3264_c0_g1~~TRINITY_DN3264_c0_g1_i1.p1  ORF type:complete len:293 (+),score=-32.72 TRINITY_DN3264_c0_g1_i1:730-1608(+)